MIRYNINSQISSVHIFLALSRHSPGPALALTQSTIEGKCLDPGMVAIHLPEEGMNLSRRYLLCISFPHPR